jgi:transcriptional regulator with XRE-family HTH domain
VSILRAVRLLRGEALEAIAVELGCMKSTLSHVERWPTTIASPKLRKALEARYQAPWRILAQHISPDMIATAIVNALQKES